MKCPNCSANCDTNVNDFCGQCGKRLSSRDKRPDSLTYMLPPPPPIEAYQPPLQPPPIKEYQPSPQRKKSKPFIIGACLGLLVLLSSGILGAWYLPKLYASQCAYQPLKNSITKAPNGSESIGISDGGFAFDTNRPDGQDKIKAATDLQAGKINDAYASLHTAITKDASDAEADIYREDLNILTACRPHVTIVVATTLTGSANNIAVGRENLQGAFIAQQEYNSRSMLPNDLRVVLLIANSGSNEDWTKDVANQIVQLASQDPTVIGVMGWTFSDQSLIANAILENAKLPMVSTSSEDNLNSPYFFRVAVPSQEQGIAASQYAKQFLHVKTAVIFEDKNNDYSKRLVEGFKQDFPDSNHTILNTVSYAKGDGVKNSTHLQNQLEDALCKGTNTSASCQPPGLIYFAGYPEDAGVLFAKLQAAHIPLMGGNALYQEDGYPPNALGSIKGLLYFTAAFYPDEWDAMRLSKQISQSDPDPYFFNEYSIAFDPLHTGKYGAGRATSGTVLSYDATSILLYGSQMALTQKSNISGEDLRNALAGISAFPGVSGKISFKSGGIPIQKEVTVVFYDKNYHYQLCAWRGQFLVNGPDYQQFQTPPASNCSVK